ncbi:MAG TPA: tetratricopeptide repeat protein [Candidatus Sulfotelmatobacter sp.]|nr:tetratricopeptide repeat protein [Candidatus Sulfotelmatobacter sp.]
MTEKKRIAVLLLVSVLVYLNTLGNGFTMDDDAYIFHNAGVTAHSFRVLFQPTWGSNLFRPFTYFTLMLNWLVGSDHPFGYHLFNVFLHAAVTLLLYLVLRRLLDSVSRSELIAFVAALLFAVHPIHTEAVASIVGRSEGLAMAFVLAAWLLHLEDHPYWAFVCFALALLSKESAIIFVPLVCAGDLARGVRKPIFRYAGVALVGVLYLGLLWHVQGGRFGAAAINFLDNPLALFPARLRIPNALRIDWKYLGLQFYPVSLSCDYSYNAIPLYAKFSRNALAVVAVLLLLTLWLWTFFAAKKPWFLAGALYLIGFSVTSNVLMPTGTIMAERLAYLPSAGFCLFLALLWILFEQRSQRAAWAALVVVLLLFSARTVARNRDWHDNFSLFNSSVRVVPKSAKMRAGLGDQYMQRGQLDAARSELETALHIFPDYWQAVGVLAVVEARQGHDQEALRTFEKELALTPKTDRDYDLVRVSLAAQLIKVNQNDRALTILNQVVQSSPANPRAWANRAVILYQRGQFQAARSDAETALHLEPTNPQAQNLLAQLNATAPSVPHQ